MLVAAHQLAGNPLASPSLQYALKEQSLCALQTFLQVGPPGVPSSTQTLPAEQAGDWPQAGREGAADDEHPIASRSPAIHADLARLGDIPLTDRVVNFAPAGRGDARRARARGSA